LTYPAATFHRLPPGTDTGEVTCAECGHTWVTTPDQDRLLAEIFEHQATHVRPPTGAAPSSTDPAISTR
jgi:hypothetical protein